MRRQRGDGQDPIEVDPAKDRGREPHTQAAISAREHAYAADGFNGRLTEARLGAERRFHDRNGDQVGRPLYLPFICLRQMHLAREEEPQLWLVQALSNR